jgi:hypothetical protein
MLDLAVMENTPALTAALTGFGGAAAVFLQVSAEVRPACITACHIKTDHADETVRAGKLADYRQRADVILRALPAINGRLINMNTSGAEK